jgi:nucleoside-diphosphate-sugar epimerase
MAERFRVLVTGANTAIGRQLVHELYRDQQGIELVWALGSEELPYYFRDFHRERFTYRVVNLAKPRQLRELFLSEPFKHAEVDTVVHLDFLPKPSYNGDPVDIVVEATRQFLNHCLATPHMKKFIFNSGSLVYKLRPWTSCCIEEDSELNFDPGADVWTRARVDADMLCRAKMDNGRLRIVVLRPSPIIGRNVSSHLNGFFESYLLTTLAGFDPMLRPVHSDDVRKAIKLAIHADVQGVFNVAGRDIAPLSEFCRLSGRPVVAAPFAVVRRLNRLQRTLGLTDCNLDNEPSWLKFSCILDTRKIERKMGFEPEMHIKFG